MKRKVKVNKMPKSTRTNWRYVAIPVELADRISQVVDKDRYPMGKWHSKDHFVIQCLKDKLVEIDAQQEKPE